MARKASIQRSTKETNIEAELDLDGKGIFGGTTSIPFMDHMLELFARHGHFDLKIEASGDIEVGLHHIVEDLGICLGQAVDRALEDRAGISRFGESRVPMDEALAEIVIDLSGRPFLAYNVAAPTRMVGDFDIGLAEEFFRAVSVHARANLHINLSYGKDPHHILEAVFKSFGKALKSAARIEGNSKDVPSTKGIL